MQAKTKRPNLGALQNRLPFDFANTMQGLGERARYVKIGGVGRNALDFHLAFYLGDLVREDPGGVFRIVSKDSGFDPLIEHLQARGLDVERWHELPGSPPGAIGVTATLI